MKFYLTKAAQLEAEGRGPKTPRAAKAPKPAKAPKAARVAKVAAEKPVKAPRASKIAPSSAPIPGAPVLSDAPASVAPVAPSPVMAAPATPAPVVPAAVVPMTASSAPAAAAPMIAEARNAKALKAPRLEKQPKPAKGVVAIGGLPRVDLLPPEVRAERRAAVNVRRAWTAVAGLAVLVGLAGGTAAIYEQSSESTLVAAQNETSQLANRAAGFSEVKTVQSDVDLIDAARLVGGSTDIDWPAYLAKVKSTVPGGMTLSTVAIDSASPIADYAQSTTPLEGQRVATLTFSATSSSLPSVPTWLTKLATLPGYTDAQAGTITRESGLYTANVVVHIDESAFSGDYSKAGK